MILINYSHPLTEDQRKQIETLAQTTIEEIVDLPVQFDNQQSYPEQLKQLFEFLPLSAETMQTQPVVVILPSLNFIAAMVLAELHGRMGYFPPVIRLRLVPDCMPPAYEVVEISNLQVIRDQARKRRNGS